jgi:CRP-like cAMP-binding protein
MDFHEYFNAFHSISKEDFETFSKQLRPKNFIKGEYIIKEGEIQRELLLVIRGFQMSFLNHEGRPHVVAFTYPPGLCSIPDSFLLQKPSNYFLQCITDSSFEAITLKDLELLFDRVPSIERLFRKITERVLIGLIQRHVDLHVLTIEQRFKAFATRSPQLLHLIPHKHIASYLDIDPTNFSKLFNSTKI